MIRPPRKAVAFLRWFCREDCLEEIEGDLTEVFEKEFKKSPSSARRKFMWRVLKYFRPEFLRPLKNIMTQNSFHMYKSYVTIGWRNLLKQKLYALINIGGLTIGLTTFILVMQYILHEVSFDRFHKNAVRIYHVYQRQAGNNYMGSEMFGVTPARLSSVMMEEIPEVESATAVHEQEGLVSYEGSSFYERGLWADSHFFEVFSFPILKGNPAKMLADPKNIIITRTLAEKLFGQEDPLNRTVRFGNEDLLVVTGVLADLPANSSFQFSYITHIQTNDWLRDELQQPTWSNNSIHTFFLLAEGAHPIDVENKFSGIIQKYRNPLDYKDYPFTDTYFTLPLPSMHLTSGFNADIGMKSNKGYLYLFAGVAFIVLLLASVNYMNLAIARSIKRAREVGVRKIVGAAKGQLIEQFLGESIFVSFLSLLLALGASALLMPFFAHVMDGRIEMNLWQNPLLLPGLFLLVVIVGVISGSYPTFVMSSLKPIHVLRGKVVGKVSGTRLQQALIVVQYVASTVMVLGSLVIYQQIKFMRTRELGYDKHHVITIPVRDQALVEKYQTLKNEWRQFPGVISTSLGSSLPTRINSSHLLNDEDGSGPEDDLAIYEWRVDEDFLDVSGIRLAAGAGFTADENDAKHGIMLNETAAKALGWTPQEAIGKEIRDYNQMNTVVGVVRDFHMHSMHLAIQPLMIRQVSNWINFISIKVDPERQSEIIARLEKSMARISPYPFEYQMLDDQYDQLYKSEVKLGEIFGAFTVLAIVIAALGLFGLAAFSSEQRTKEIGIRKTLGASIQNITLLLSRDFLKLVTIAFVASIPLAWYLMNMWLQGFAYRTHVDWTLFTLAGSFTLIIANLAITYQSIKAAVANPVKSLRSE